MGKIRPSDRTGRQTVDVVGPRRPVFDKGDVPPGAGIDGLRRGGSVESEADIVVPVLQGPAYNDEGLLAVHVCDRAPKGHYGAIA